VWHSGRRREEGRKEEESEADMAETKTGRRRGQKGPKSVCVCVVKGGSVVCAGFFIFMRV